VERPNELELAVNLKVTRELGILLPSIRRARRPDHRMTRCWDSCPRTRSSSARYRQHADCQWRDRQLFLLAQDQDAPGHGHRQMDWPASSGL